MINLFKISAATLLLDLTCISTFIHSNGSLYVFKYFMQNILESIFDKI